ncbi:MAG: hypothetical protein D6715_05805, partial [Calditrichaeota bacterium]
AQVLLAGLRHLLADSALQVVVDTSATQPLPPLLPLAHYLTRAQRNRPELAALRATERAAAARVGLARSRLYPQLAAQLTYHYARPGVNFFQNAWMDYYTVAVQMSLPLWDWGRRKQQVRQARLQQQTVDWHLRETKLAIEQQVQEAYWQVRSTLDQVQWQRRLVAQEKERYRRMKSRFASGLISPLDFRSAEAALTEAELTLQSLQSQLARAFLELAYATGELTENQKDR